MTMQASVHPQKKILEISTREEFEMIKRDLEMVMLKSWLLFELLLRGGSQKTRRPIVSMKYSPGDDKASGAPIAK